MKEKKYTFKLNAFQVGYLYAVMSNQPENKKVGYVKELEQMAENQIKEIREAHIKYGH